MPPEVAVAHTGPHVRQVNAAQLALRCTGPVSPVTAALPEPTATRTATLPGTWITGPT